MVGANGCLLHYMKFRSPTHTLSMIFRFWLFKGFSLKKWFKKQKNLYLRKWASKWKIEVLNFLQLLKFDKTKWLHFFILSSNSRDIAIFLFSAKQGLKNHWKKTKCPYLGYNGLKWNKPDSRSNHKLRPCVIQGNIVLIHVLSGWRLGFKQIHCLLMYNFNFHFLCFALNLFLPGVLACVVNLYQQTDGRTDQWKSWDIKFLTGD